MIVNPNNKIAPFNKINSLTQRTQDIASKEKEIAEKIETQFIKMLLEEMNKSAENEEEKNSAKDYYKGLLTSEYADIISKKDGGIGLQKMILAQLKKYHSTPATITPASANKEATNE